MPPRVRCPLVAARLGKSALHPVATPCAVQPIGRCNTMVCVKTRDQESKLVIDIGYYSYRQVLHFLLRKERPSVPTFQGPPRPILWISGLVASCRSPTILWPRALACDHQICQAVQNGARASPSSVWAVASSVSTATPIPIPYHTDGADLLDFATIPSSFPPLSFSFCHPQPHPRALVARGSSLVADA